MWSDCCLVMDVLWWRLIRGDERAGIMQIRSFVKSSVTMPWLVCRQGRRNTEECGFIKFIYYNMNNHDLKCLFDVMGLFVGALADVRRCHMLVRGLLFFFLAFLENASEQQSVVLCHPTHTDDADICRRVTV